MDAVSQVLRDVGADEVSTVEVYNKCDLLSPDELRRIRDLDPDALCLSALERRGIDDLIDALMSRLALDVRRVTLTFDPDEPGDREQIGRVYRHGRVIEQETRNGRISIVADIPRRLIDRLSSRALQEPAGR